MMRYVSFFFSDFLSLKFFTKNNIYNKKNKGKTCLHYVVTMNGSKDIVNFLIEHKINITAKDKQNKTAIEYANENIQEEIVSTLIEMWPKQTKLPLPPNVANIKNRIEEVKIRNQKAEERIKRQKMKKEK